ncbi:MAG: hypothetical protein KY476_05580 [Planctomycetes bacterium]|nr:hypothetical protein [Planctomycetota bacterium]
MVDIGSRRELFVDDLLIDRLSGDVERRLHHPTPQDVALNFDAPWEGSGSNYVTVFRDGDLYRMYYRGAQLSVEDGKLVQPHAQVTCYAESRDGIEWTRPNLGLFEWEGSKQNNIVWTEGRATHNFTPFKDTRPGVPDDERYKALAYAPQGGRALAAFASPDGLRWRLLHEQPVLTHGVFDSQNLAFWDDERGEYRAYFRDFREGRRDIRTATSRDFRTWSEAEWLEYPGSEPQQLYTNQIEPYDRAPHLFIGLPTRYLDRGWSESMRALPEREHRERRAGANRRYGTALTDTLLMTSRDGRTFHRWSEAFISPGPQRPGTWNYGHLYTAWHVIETPSRLTGAPPELSLFATESAWTGTDSLLRRYTLRLDGFVSVHASGRGGELLTRPLRFGGDRLEINFATSAAGSVRVEIQDVDGKPIPGFTLDDCPPHFGDEPARTVVWKDNSDVGRLAGRPVRLRFTMNEADLYSLRFHSDEPAGDE